jgi:hypothetical protein
MAKNSIRPKINSTLKIAE